MLELGASFKKAREGRNLSIEEIAAETRISGRFLLAIENEQFDLLPGGVFNRGFIRTFADRVGLDAEEAIRNYERLSRPPEVESRPDPPKGRTQKESAKPSVYYFAIAGLAVAVIAFYIVAHQRSLPVEPASAAISEAVLPTPPVTPSELSPEIPPTPVASTETPAAATSVPRAATPQTRAAPAPTSPIKAEAPVVVEMEFQENSWFKLTADGSPVVNGEILSRGASRRYTANESINLSIGNAAGVTLRVNGQQVSSLGRNGQVRMLNITPNTSAASLAE